MTQAPKRSALLLVLCLSTAWGSGARYFGLSPPAEPALFEPAFPGSSMGALTAISFTPDFAMAAFSAMDENAAGKVAGAIHESRLRGGEWSVPRRSQALFDSGLPSGEGAFSPDGRWLYFSSDRPPGAERRPRIFRSAVARSRLAAPQYVAVELPPDAGAYYPRLLAGGHLSFTSRGSHGKDDLFIARARKGGFEKPEPLGGDFNSPQDDWDLIESRDGTLRIWASARDGSIGRTDLYYSHREPSRQWLPARNLTAVNTAALETAPALSPDDEVLFFLRRISGKDRMFWVRLDAVLER
jgi:hypothetical protein